MRRPTPPPIDWKPDRSSPTPLVEQIVSHVCEQASSGAWPIGTRLPSQRALAEHYGVNRSTVTAAIEELTGYGIVAGARGAGTRIVSNTWSLMLPKAPGWTGHVSDGPFHANNATIRTINRMEYADGITRMGTGEIDPRLFPHEMWRQVAGEAAAEIDTFGYPPPEGLPMLREAIAAHMRTGGVNCSSEQVLVTSGALQALQLISVSLLPPDTTVLTESPSYIASLQVFQSAGIRLAGVPMDEGGLRIDMLHGMLGVNSRSERTGAPDGTHRMDETDGTDDAMLRAMLAAAKANAGTGPSSHTSAPRTSVAALYTIPTNHNPTGVTMSDAHRRELLTYCEAARLPIIEDCAYQELCFDAATPMPLKAMDRTGTVIMLGSASKTLAPGLRIGWIVADEPIVQRLADVKMQMDYGASTLSQWVFARFLTSGLHDEYVTGLREELRRRRDAALASLERWFTGLAHWRHPTGGFYIWLTFDRPVRTERLFRAALERGILLNPGDMYGAWIEQDAVPGSDNGPRDSNSLRLSYSYTTPEEFSEAARTLASLL